ncbi:hypothetical protein ACFLYU_03680 [Candidatus Dependentiae bacterium]
MVKVNSIVFFSFFTSLLMFQCNLFSMKKVQKGPKTRICRLERNKKRQMTLKLFIYNDSKNADDLEIVFKKDSLSELSNSTAIFNELKFNKDKLNKNKNSSKHTISGCIQSGSYSYSLKKENVEKKVSVAKKKVSLVVKNICSLYTDYCKKSLSSFIVSLLGFGKKGKRKLKYKDYSDKKVKKLCVKSKNKKFNELAKKALEKFENFIKELAYQDGSECIKSKDKNFNEFSIDALDTFECLIDGIKKSKHKK